MLDDHLSDLEREYMLRFEHREPTEKEAKEFQLAFLHEKIRLARSGQRVYFIVGIIVGMIILRAIEYYF